MRTPHLLYVGRYLQCVALSRMLPPDYTGPIPGAYHVLAGTLPVPEATDQQLRDAARKVQMHVYADVDRRGKGVLKGTPALVDSTSPRYGEKAPYWDHAPVHGAPLRDYLATPDLHLRLVRLPADSPDFNAAEHIWDGVRAEVTANTCFGTADKVRAHIDPFFVGLATRTDEVKRRCRTVLQTKADAIDAAGGDQPHTEGGRLPPAPA